PRPPAPPDKNKPAKPDTVRRPPDLKGLRLITRLFMSIRNINGNYTLTEGTILPGFTETPKLLGMDQNWNSPGWGFILGEQDPNFAQKAAANRWLTRNKKLTNPFSQNQTEELTLRANLEPFTDLKIQLDARRTINSSFQEIFKDTTGNGTYRSISPTRSGSYRISFLSINTAFDNNSNLVSDVFERFKTNIGILAARFPRIGGTTEVNQRSQDVLIPAFIAAYSGTSVDGTSLSPFPKIPLPNWRVDYTGLTKLSGLKDIFQSVTINHAYTSNYSVVNYTNSLRYTEGKASDIDVRLSSQITDYNTGKNFGSIASTSDSSLLIPVYVIDQVMINETFAPLIGINVRTKSKMNLRFEYKTKRDVSLKVSNAQITEQLGKDWSFEMSFTKNNMKLPFKDQGRTITLKNDVTFL
ncbi:MAG: cell surface protein SprA, partial [Flammeovirgaceae bacterium]